VAHEGLNKFSSTFLPENSTQFDQNFKADAGFSIDEDIAPEGVPKYVPRGKSMCNSH